MANHLLIQFEPFPKEKELISEILLSYGELEFVMLDILNAVLKNSQTAVRVLYQLRSEGHRLNIVEAIANPWFEANDLGSEFKEGMAAVNLCKRIRNQYAHCTFMADENCLRFANLEITAKSKGPKCEVVSTPITLPLIERQRAYFDYTDHMLLWLDYTYRTKNGQPVAVDQPIPKPQRIHPPKLNSRGEARPRRYKR